MRQTTKVKLKNNKSVYNKNYGEHLFSTLSNVLLAFICKKSDVYLLLCYEKYERYKNIKKIRQ